MNPLRHVSWLWGIVTWLESKLRERQRAVDIRTLWVSCKERTDDLESARAVFSQHAFHDRAWLVLGDDEIKRRIDGLS